MADDEVRSCPFCGNSSISIVETDTYRWRAAQCGNCGATGPEVRIQTVGEGSKDDWERSASKDAVAEWNKRA